MAQSLISLIVPFGIPQVESPITPPLNLIWPYGSGSSSICLNLVT